MTMRFRKGYKRHLQRIIKERNLKKRIRHEYHYIQRINFYPTCTFNGYVVDDRGIIRQVNKYSPRYQFKTPKYYRRVRRYYLNKNIDDINITSLGRNYQKISRNT